MGSRAFRITLLLFEALWLNVIVPGHQRGIVRLPGDACSSCAARPYVPACCTTQTDNAGKDLPASGDPAERCAICHFAAMLSLPPVVDLSPPPLGLLRLLPVPMAEQSASVQFTTPYDGRAPPAGCFHLA